MKHKFNYFYKITNTINGHFYYGIHSTDNLDDGYMGSGTRLKTAYKKYGMENFEKEILKFFNTRKEASDYEAEMVTETLIKEDNCYNIKKGGDDFDLSGLVSVFDTKEKKNIFIPQEKFYHENIRGRYVAQTYGKVNVLRKEDNERLTITVEEFNNNKNKYIGFAKGKVTVKDKYNNFYQVSVDDERYKNGELVPVWSGRKHNVQDIEKMKKTLKQINHQQGDKNSQYGTCWITNGEVNKKVKKEELDFYVSDGWHKGRYSENKKYTEYDIEQIKEMRLKSCKWTEIQNTLKIPKTSLRDIRIKYNIQ